MAGSEKSFKWFKIFPICIRGKIKDYYKFIPFALPYSSNSNHPHSPGWILKFNTLGRAPRSKNEK